MSALSSQKYMYFYYKYNKELSPWSFVILHFSRMYRRHRYKNQQYLLSDSEVLLAGKSHFKLQFSTLARAFYFLMFLRVRGKKRER